MHPVGDDDCRRCDEKLPIPLDGCVGDVEPIICLDCTAELAAQPYTVNGSAVVTHAAGLPELGKARAVISWVDSDTLVESPMAVWLEGDRAAEHYALALASLAMQQPLRAVVTVHPRTGTTDVNGFAV